MLSFWSRVLVKAPHLDEVVKELRRLNNQTGTLLKWQVRTADDWDPEEQLLDTVREAIEDEQVYQWLTTYDEEKSAEISKGLALFAKRVHELMEALNDSRLKSAIPGLMTQWARMAVKAELCCDQLQK